MDKINEKLREIHILLQSQKFQLALKKIDKLIALDRDNLDLLINKSSILIAMGKFNEAEHVLLNLKNKVPNDSDLNINLGLVSQKLEKFEDAINFYKSALNISPNNFHINFNLAQLYLDIDEANLALIELNKIKIQCDNSDYYHQLLAESYIRNLDFENAMRHHQIALEKNPNAKNFYLLATDYLWSGDKIKAKELYLKAINTDYLSFEAYLAISKIERFDINTDFYKKIINLLNTQNLKNHEKSYLYFSLFNIYENSMKFKDAIKSLHQANKLRENSKKFNFQYYKTLVQKIKKNYQNLSSINFPPFTDKRDKIPIFILGMPRSGTSLVEQIISGNNEVFGAGEVNLFHESMKRMIQKGIGVSELISLAEKYSRKMSDITNKRFIIDKLPLNFFWIGFISKIFPKAKIIHLRRNGMDTCFSIYKNFFIDGALEFSYKQADIRDFYQIYSLIIDFWSEVVPDKILHLDYESLVQNPNIEGAKLFDFVGLDFKDDYLDIAKNKRWVLTASDHQLRDKINKKESPDWYPYENDLQILSKFFN